jgi:succinate dehydrogenase/fumarate reductase flavoprotein subunit
MGWKELKMGLVRIMQDYCGECKNDEVLEAGLRWLNSMRESELASAYARNPHELGRTLEAMSQATLNEIIIQATLAHKASSRPLDLKRLDYPQMDPPEWRKYMTIQKENGRIKTGGLPLNYWLLPPNAPSYEENYQNHCEL